MDKDSTNCRLLLVDDEEDFRSAVSRTLGRRGFTVTEAVDGQEALEAIRRECPDIVVLDLKMPGMGGIETLQEIRRIKPTLPVIILTGHGEFETAMASIRLEVVDFLQKPVQIEQLGMRIRALLEGGIEGPLREATISELMVSPSVYPRIYVDEPVTTVLEAFRSIFCQPALDGTQPGEIRSALVYDRNDEFLGIIRLNNLLRLLIPPFLGDSPYATCFTGMFLAQCKLLGNRSIHELIGDQVFVDFQAPLMEAVNLMDKYHLVNLAVMEKNRLVGVIRGRDIILEISRTRGFQNRL